MRYEDKVYLKQKRLETYIQQLQVMYLTESELQYDNKIKNN